MASQVCLRCLARPNATRLIPLAAFTPTATPIASFSTTSTLSKGGKKIPKKPATAAKKPAYAVARRNAKAGSATTNRKDPAAVRAQRKRVVLSNPNALQVSDLKELTASNVLDSEEGAVLGLGNDTIDALRAAEAFKHNQGWNLFRQPSTLVTRATREMAELVQQAQADKSVYRELVVGEKGAGKSVLALQTMAFAAQAGWVVIHIPEAQDLVLSNTSYAPTRTASGTIIYTQPDYTAALLSRISKANTKVLSTLQLSKQHTFPIPIDPKITLARLADLGAADPTLAPAIFSALLTELLSPSTETHPRPAMHFSLDGLAHLCRPTAYLSRDADPLHALDLAIPATFAGLLSGATPLPNGGIVQALDSNSNRPAAPALEARIRGEQARPFLAPYKAWDERVASLLANVDLRTVQGLSRAEARGLMEYYARSGVVRGVVDEKSVGEAWTLAGGGVLGELESGMTRLRV